MLEELECPDIKSLGVGKNATYRSETTAKDFLNSAATVVREKVQKLLDESPYISILADETTDISVQKKLVVSARLLNPVTCQPSTHFLNDITIRDGTGASVYHAIEAVLIERKIPKFKIMAFGTDGAKAMTGEGEGATGYFLRKINPMAFNMACVAHKLALCTSQAADSDNVPFFKDYQKTLTNIFYFFKRSALRVGILKEVQEILEEPTLKVKEVHDVRWMTIYQAVETVYRTLDSLITYFANNPDASATGYGKKLSHQDFVHTTYMLMDVLPVVSKLCLLFQRKDLDLPIIQVAVNTCISDLESLKSDPNCLHGADTYTKQLKDQHLGRKDNKPVFKDNVMNGRLNIDNIRDKFLDELLKNLKKRFPEESTNLLTAFGALGMRPVTFLSHEDLLVWGNEKLEELINKYGKDQQAPPRKNYQEETIKTESIIDPVSTRAEWIAVKQVVVNEGYPRDTMAALWELIRKYHSESFPNLIKLAEIALVAPTHTADCERAFSQQNLIKNSSRNRLSGPVLDDLLVVNLEGPPFQDMDFHEILKVWREVKERRIEKH